MFIQTEATPNPATLKFLPGRVVLAESTFEARDAEAAARSPLAAALADAQARAEAATVARAEAQASAASSEAAAMADERTEAVRTVLGAVLASIGHRALDRRRFQDLIARAGREAPDQGPGAARHAVLLTEARRVLGIAE